MISGARRFLNWLSPENPDTNTNGNDDDARERSRPRPHDEESDPHTFVREGEREREQARSAEREVVEVRIIRVPNEDATRVLPDSNGSRDSRFGGREVGSDRLEEVERDRDEYREDRDEDMASRREDEMAVIPMSPLSRNEADEEPETIYVPPSVIPQTQRSTSSFASKTSLLGLCSLFGLTRVFDRNS